MFDLMVVSKLMLQFLCMLGSRNDINCTNTQCFEMHEEEDILEVECL